MIKAAHSILRALLVALLLAGCGRSVQPTAIQLAESMKGYELYSWHAKAGWNFSLLVGTNREKALDEIKSPETLLPGVDALKARLGEISPGQYISWSVKGTLAFPPEGLVRQIEEFCSAQDLILTINK